MQEGSDRGFDWAGLPVIATVARLLCRELTLQSEYLRLENRILKEKVSGRIQFTDGERRATGEMSRDCIEAMPDEDLTVGCDQFLGGLLNSYYRKAA